MHFAGSRTSGRTVECAVCLHSAEFYKIQCRVICFRLASWEVSIFAYQSQEVFGTLLTCRTTPETDA